MAFAFLSNSVAPKRSPSSGLKVPQHLQIQAFPKNLSAARFLLKAEQYQVKTKCVAGRCAVTVDHAG